MWAQINRVLMGSVVLRLFGVIHIDRPEKVTAELEEYASGTDALFIEYPEEDPNWRVYARCLLKAPAVFFGFVFMGLVQMPLFVLCNREIRPLLSTEMIAAQRLSDEYDLPLHPVDDHPLFIAADGQWRWIVINWAVVIGLAVFWPRFVATSIGVCLIPWLIISSINRAVPAFGVLVSAAVPWSVLAVGIWYGFFSPLVIASILFVFVLFFKATLNRRNRHMLHRIDDVSGDHGYENTCLITGKAHLGGLIQLAQGTDISVSRAWASKWLRSSGDERIDPGEETSERSFFDHPDPSESVYTNVLSERIVAGLIDAVCIVLLVIPIAFVGGVLFGLAFGDGAIGAGLLAGVLVTPVLYGFVLEALFGRTIGKRFLGLVVVAKDGLRCSTRKVAVRNLLRIVDFPVFYVVGFIAMVLTERRQRLGDLAAGTVVVVTDS
jgi:uncharacterized RDD family membrane protein YckC